jgi:hypothetical protein
MIPLETDFPGSKPSEIPIKIMRKRERKRKISLCITYTNKPRLLYILTYESNYIMLKLTITKVDVTMALSLSSQNINFH